jgi:hypothetical protein
MKPGFTSRQAPNEHQLELNTVRAFPSVALLFSLSGGVAIETRAGGPR